MIRALYVRVSWVPRQKRYELRNILLAFREATKLLHDLYELIKLFLLFFLA